jgi:ParB family chromosome partitioning protein
MKQSGKPQHGLGKGLGALLAESQIKPEHTTQQALTAGDAPSGTAMIEIDRIQPNPFQPRRDFDPVALRELEQSIRVHGVIQPITVRKLFDGYELIAGERRLRASIAAGLTHIPAFIKPDVSDAQMLKMAIIENIQRQDLNPLETALGYQRLIDEYTLTQDEVAGVVGKDRTTVSNLLRLLRLPDDIQAAVRSRKLSMGHARALLSLSSEAAQLVVMRDVMTKDLSVRKTEALVKDIELGRKEVTRRGEIRAVTTERPAPPQRAVNKNVAVALGELENTLRHLFATQVRVKMKADDQGAIEIDFYSLDDLQRLLDLLVSIENTSAGSRS